MGNSVAVAASSTVRLSKAGDIFCFIAHSRVSKTRDQDSNFGTNVVYSLGRAEFRFGSKCEELSVSKSSPQLPTKRTPISANCNFANGPTGDMHPSPAPLPKK